MTKLMSKMMMIALALMCAGSGACTRIGPGYVGIKVSMAGSDKGVNDMVGTTGWQFYNPLLSTVVEYPTFVQNVVWTHNLNEGNAVNEEITFTNMDQMSIAVDVSLSYQLDGGHIPHFYVKFRNDDLTKFSNNFLRNLAREKFDAAAGHYKIEDIMGNNAPFLAEVRAALQKDLDPIGVSLQQFGLIGSPRPPQAVIEAINAKVHATQLAQQKQNELVQVDADMAKERSKADTYARNEIVKAEAEAEANRKRAASLTPTLVEYIKANRWDGVLPKVTGGSGVLMNMQDK